MTVPRVSPSTSFMNFANWFELGSPHVQLVLLIFVANIPPSSVGDINFCTSNSLSKCTAQPSMKSTMHTSFGPFCDATLAETAKMTRLRCTYGGCGKCRSGLRPCDPRSQALAKLFVQLSSNRTPCPKFLQNLSRHIFARSFLIKFFFSDTDELRGFNTSNESTAKRCKKKSCQERVASCERAENGPNTECERQATEHVGKRGLPEGRQLGVDVGIQRPKGRWCCAQ